jgi:hypothetical protein
MKITHTETHTRTIVIEGKPEEVAQVAEQVVRALTAPKEQPKQEEITLYRRRYVESESD